MGKAKDWIELKVEIRERLKLFALSILDLSERIPKSTRGNVINYQLTKSGTSMYVNYRASLRGRAKAEFLSKLSITVEEADETEMRLELILTSRILQDDLARSIHMESIEIVKILSNLRKKVWGLTFIIIQGFQTSLTK